MSVVELLPNKAIAVGNEQLADRLLELAECIRSGDIEAVERVVVLVERVEENEYPRCYGRPTTNAELVGLLEYAKASIMSRSVRS